MSRFACLLLILISCSSPPSEGPERAAHRKDSVSVTTVVDTADSRVPVEREQITVEKDDGGHAFRFSAARMPFDPGRHDMSRLRDCLVDDERLYGTDCDPPRYEFREMTLEIDGKAVPIPRKFYRQFFEPSLGYKDRTTGLDAFLSMNGESVFVLMNGGDGAGAYHVAWCFRQDGNHSKMVTYDEVYFEFLDDRE
jgi:hypothetical protein